MKSGIIAVVCAAMVGGLVPAVHADQAAKVTVAVNDVTHGKTSSGGSSAAGVGTLIHDGDYLETHAKSRAELQLPTTGATITRLGASTIFNYSASSNTVDLQQGDILFCKPSNAQKLNIMTAAVTAGITGTTGFVSVQNTGKKTTYVLGLIEGHAIAHADGHPFPLGPGDVIQFTPGQKPFSYSFDIPRLVKSSPLITKFNSTLPNQSAIDKALAEYADDVSRGFITAPSNSITYSGGIPVLSGPAFSSAQNAQAQGKGGTAPPPPPPPSNPYRTGGSPFNSTSPGH